MKNKAPSVRATCAKGRTVSVGSGRLVRVPWSEAEDQDIRNWYDQANGAFLSYRYMASELNRLYHGGKPVRKPGAVCLRDGRVNYGITKRHSNTEISRRAGTEK
jgi:hypothetical protein